MYLSFLHILHMNTHQTGELSYCIIQHNTAEDDRFYGNRVLHDTLLHFEIVVTVEMPEKTSSWINFM